MQNNQPQQTQPLNYQPKPFQQQTNGNYNPSNLQQPVNYPDSPDMNDYQQQNTDDSKDKQIHGYKYDYDKQDDSTNHKDALQYNNFDNQYYPSYKPYVKPN